MNKCERLMAERMNFVSRRGITAEIQRRMWVQALRNERNGDATHFYVVVNGCATYSVKTIRQGKILGLSIVNQLRSRRLAHKNDRLTVEIYDKVTLIKLWDAER